MRFGEAITGFYELRHGSKEQVNLYFPGLTIDRNVDSYEHDLDRIIYDMRSELGQPPQIKKTALTLSWEIRDSRSDVGSMVADLWDTNFDGILFLPRPAKWVQWQYNLPNLNPDMFLSFMARLLKQSSEGIIAYNLEADHSDIEINAMQHRFRQEFDDSLIVRSPSWDSKTHLLIRNSNN